jgi:hypothetical protein
MTERQVTVDLKVTVLVLLIIIFFSRNEIDRTYLHGPRSMSTKPKVNSFIGRDYYRSSLSKIG